MKTASENQSSSTAAVSGAGWVKSKASTGVGVGVVSGLRRTTASLRGDSVASGGVATRVSAGGAIVSTTGVDDWANAPRDTAPTRAIQASRALRARRRR